MPQRPDLVAKAIMPDYALGSHVAPLGLAFYTRRPACPQHYRGGAFVGEHGSWDRAQLNGYKVVFVPFASGRPDRQGRATSSPASSTPTSMRAAGRSASPSTAAARC